MRDNKYVILVVDDDADFLQATSLFLEGSGYVVIGANSAEDGINAYKKENPDLVIVDLIMEEIDSGMKFVKELKLLGSGVPVYLLSATADEMADSVDYSELGFSGVFQKPVDTKRLLGVIKAKLK